ncbi:cytochrome c oxidase assembly protein [Pseudobacillus badius]|uniref:cytochrome c oxidase assembly protein n=1 Tax=Bacillus badius TaxID=1455 RepID=UPI0007B393EF|nr:cytochrome c oxidase assembly protein [Bacillus badius]KZR58031.1 hypothetical protein A3781_01380 [Bacillus badius]
MMGSDICYAGEQLSKAAPQVLLALPFLFALCLYLAAVAVSNRYRRKWPYFRTACWVAGISLVLSSVTGPLAARAHVDFTAHMAGHLLLGMAAPLLLVMAAPVTLILRTLPTGAARTLARLLKSKPIRFLSDPAVAALLNVGGLWVLYTTELYRAMHESLFLHLFIHFHVFLAGYLFTAVILYIDPIPHQKSFLYRALVLILALAGHGILSKYIYAHPPAGVAEAQAKMGGVFMYYGGDAIDMILVFLLCLYWYRSARPRKPLRESVSKTV